VLKQRWCRLRNKHARLLWAFRSVNAWITHFLYIGRYFFSSVNWLPAKESFTLGWHAVKLVVCFITYCFHIDEDISMSFVYCVFIYIVISASRFLRVVITCRVMSPSLDGPRFQCGLYSFMILEQSSWQRMMSASLNNCSNGNYVELTEQVYYNIT